MQKKYLITLFAITLTVAVFGQKKGSNGADYDFNCKCLGVELDGSTTLESFGKGRNYWDASEQAKKNAVWAIIFYGIKEGSGGCSSDPLLFSAEPQKTHEEFFNAFFQDEGVYNTYVSLSDEKIKNKVSRNAKKSKEMQQRMVVVRVDRAGLKKFLKENKIE